MGADTLEGGSAGTLTVAQAEHRLRRARSDEKEAWRVARLSRGVGAQTKGRLRAEAQQATKRRRRAAAALRAAERREGATEAVVA